MRNMKPASALLLGLLTSCSFIPDYHRPALPVSAQYPYASGGQGPAAADLGWKQFFSDPALQDLITLSLNNNRNLRVSVLNIQQAEAQYRVDRASLFPTVEGAAELYRSHGHANVSSGGQEADMREYSVGAQVVSWELDLFGKIRSEAQAAHESYLSDTDTALSDRIALIAEVSSEYFAWLADRESLQIAQDTVAADLESLQLTQLETTHGIATALDVAQAQSTYDTASADVAQFQRQVGQDMDQLVLLVGTPIPPDILQKMQAVTGLADEPPLPLVPAGLPSDLLVRRPDIRAAEHALLAANANIGAARAAFFPSISLTANSGFVSNSLSNLFEPGQRTWVFEPQITVPIFTGGENLANLDVAKVEKRIEIANYEQTIQSAFHDVSDALVARQTYVDQVQAQQNLVGADTRSYQLSKMRFTAGIDNYLSVLVAQDSLLSARLTLVSLQLAQQQNEITLYKALGGGWQESGMAVASTTPAASTPTVRPVAAQAPPPASPSKPVPLTN